MIRPSIPVLASMALLSATSSAQIVIGYTASPLVSSPVLAPPVPPNLRLSIACADNPFVTAETGLAIAIDGQPVPAQGTDYGTESGITKHGYVATWTVAVDVGYVVPQGRHELKISAPGCLPVTREVEIPPMIPLRLDGSLQPIPRLRGPVDAPDGLTFAIGGFYPTFPASLASGTASVGMTDVTQYSIDKVSLGGLFLSTGIERRYFLFASDFAFGGGSYSGNVTPEGGIPGQYPVTGTELVTALTFRFGARLPLRYVALAAGAGLGGSIWIVNTANVDTGRTSNFDVNTIPDSLEGVHVLWHIPVWAAVEVKPFCNWGAEVVASYNVQPTDVRGNFFLIGAAMMLQPSSSCSREPSLRAL